MAEKYVIFKIEDWRYIADAFQRIWGEEARATLEALADPRRVPDGVVIRRQDIFAPPALDAYANALLTAVQLLKADPGGYNERIVKDLEEKAQYFHEQAVLAWDTDRKVPD